MGYLADWQAAKHQFETATGRKKPSEKFAGVFRKSSGLENACKALDDALRRPTVNGLTKAMQDYEKARVAYTLQLENADHAERGEPYRDEINRLKAVLKHILDDYAQRRLDLVDELSGVKPTVQDLLTAETLRHAAADRVKGKILLAAFRKIHAEDMYLFLTEGFAMIQSRHLQAVWDKYLKEGAPFQVHIDETLLERIEKQIGENNGTGLHAAQEIIWNEFHQGVSRRLMQEL